MDLDNLVIASPISTMIYTPGRVDLSGVTLTGNVYAGSVCIGSTVNLTFNPMGIPGWEGGGGGGSGGGGSGSFGPWQVVGGDAASPVSQRNVD